MSSAAFTTKTSPDNEHTMAVEVSPEFARQLLAINEDKIKELNSDATAIAYRWFFGDPEAEIKSAEALEGWVK